ncbi:hypothetical protein B0T18DRAFT_121663 [Schizothecium vesticola]|uniref:Helicase C-terminal domain-containing protein n=1 Tax=Schizothecium vesticola TaxID=314040 RepID=A0AA40F358_9PEZI|nr:hypothetical protein B0T18DRAFT_121663 [Schizothecium vesticola]
MRSRRDLFGLCPFRSLTTRSPPGHGREHRFGQAHGPNADSRQAPARHVRNQPTTTSVLRSVHLIRVASCRGCQFDFPTMACSATSLFTERGEPNTYPGIEEYTHRVGRTTSHRGLATSFFTERDEPMASVLTRLGTPQETNQDIPDFLEQYKVGDGRKLLFVDPDFEG